MSINEHQMAPFSNFNKGQSLRLYNSLKMHPILRFIRCLILFYNDKTARCLRETGKSERIVQSDNSTTEVVRLLINVIATISTLRCDFHCGEKMDLSGSGFFFPSIWFLKDSKWPNRKWAETTALSHLPDVTLTLSPLQCL